MRRASKNDKGPPPTCFCMQGRSRKRERCQNALQIALRAGEVEIRTASKKQEKSNSGALLHTRWGSVNGVEIRHKSTSGSLLHAREVEEARTASTGPPAHFARKGGGGSSVS